jgi:hypothetical protein
LDEAVPSPGGRFDNSPAVHCRERMPKKSVPKGRLNLRACVETRPVRGPKDARPRQGTGPTRLAIVVGVCRPRAPTRRPLVSQTRSEMLENLRYDGSALDSSRQGARRPGWHSNFGVRISFGVRFSNFGFSHDFRNPQALRLEITARISERCTNWKNAFSWIRNRSKCC